MAITHPMRNRNSLLEVLPHVERVHLILAQIVEAIRSDESAAVESTVCMLIRGATAEKVHPHLVRMKDMGLLEKDMINGYCVTGFGVEVLQTKFPHEFDTTHHEDERRVDEAHHRIALIGA